MYSLPSFLLPFFMASLTTLSLKSVRVPHPFGHLRFLACMRHRVRIRPVHLRMRCTTVRDHAHRGEVSLSVRLILRKIRNILSIRRTLDISSKNRCCNCDLYSGKYGTYVATNSVVRTRCQNLPLTARRFIIIIIIIINDTPQEVQ